MRLVDVEVDPSRRLPLCAPPQETRARRAKALSLAQQSTEGSRRPVGFTPVSRWRSVSTLKTSPSADPPQSKAIGRTSSSLPRLLPARHPPRLKAPRPTPRSVFENSPPFRYRRHPTPPVCNYPYTQPAQLRCSHRLKLHLPPAPPKITSLTPRSPLADLRSLNVFNAFRTLTAQSQLPNQAGCLVSRAWPLRNGR